MAVTAFAIQNDFFGKRPLFHKIRSFPCARQIPAIAFPYPSGGIYFLNLFSKSLRLSRFRKISPAFGKDAFFSRRIIAFFNANATLFAPSERVLTPSKRESRRFRRRKGNFPKQFRNAQIYDYLINRNRLNFIFIGFRFQNAFLTLCNDFYSTYLPRYRETGNRANYPLFCA